jgi:NAD(P)-dependent dehydrogenase (short-subunit alcohol dehydrogenase family)
MAALTGRTALVTGGSRGIGRAICLRLARDGADIILHYHRNRAAAEKVAVEIGCEVRLVHADAGSFAEVEAMFRGLSGISIDFLVNNAGVWRASPLGKSDPAVVDELVDTNLKGPFWVTHFALPVLKDGARIINISSVAGRIVSSSGRSLYGAVKAGLEALTRNWAMELAPRKILVNAVAPGYVTSDMTAEYFSDPANVERALSRHMLGRIGEPEDIADVVAFLCSEDARFITGQTIVVSGGSVI